jgi:hypothetical protein
MAAEWSKGQRQLLTIAVLCAVILLGDIIALNVAGEVSSGWWVPAVPIGLLLVPLVGLACLAALVAQRRHT